jgi:hypothetical protein
MCAGIWVALAAQVSATLLPAAFFELRRGLRQQGAAFGRALTARLNSLRKKSGSLWKGVPQGLKPNVFAKTYGTDKSVPFQNSAFFRNL